MKKIWQDKYMEWVIYASVVLVPITFLPFVNSVFTAPKLFVFRIITLLVVFLWAAKFMEEKSVKVVKSPFFWFLCAFGLISIINTVFSTSVWTSLFGTYGRFMGIFTVINFLFWAFIIIQEFSNYERIRKLLWVSVLTSIFIAAYGLLQYLGIFGELFNWSQDPTDRVFSTIGHSNHTAAYLGMNLMIAVGLLRSMEFGWKRVGLWITCIAFFIIIILTASRGGVLALLLVSFIYFLRGLTREKFIKQLKINGKWLLFAFFVIFLGFVSFRGPLSNIGLVQRTVETFNFVQEGNVPDRISWWLSSADMIKDKPVLGHGLSTFKDNYNKYRRTDYRLPDDAQDMITPDTAHNEYLNIMVTQGILGFLVYLSMIVAVFVIGTKFIIRSKETNHIEIMFALLAAIGIYLIQVFISFGVITTLFVFYTFSGLVIGLSNTLDLKTVKLKLPVYIRVIFGTLMVLFSVGMLYFTQALFFAEYEFKNAQKAGLANFPLAIEKYEKTIALMPYTPKYYEAYGDFILNTGLQMPKSSQTTYLLDAINNYDKAIKLNIHPPYVHLNRGLAYSRLADIQDDQQYIHNAVESYTNAQNMSPNNPVYSYKLAQLLEYFGRYDEALFHYISTRDIRDSYKDTEDKIKELEELSSATP